MHVNGVSKQTEIFQLNEEMSTKITTNNEEKKRNVYYNYTTTLQQNLFLEGNSFIISSKYIIIKIHKISSK